MTSQEAFVDSVDQDQTDDICSLISIYTVRFI